MGNLDDALVWLRKAGAPWQDRCALEKQERKGDGGHRKAHEGSRSSRRAAPGDAARSRSWTP